MQDLGPVSDPGRKSRTGLWTVLAIVIVVVGAVAAAGGYYFVQYHRTPRSIEPPPPNVSYKKWEKTSNLSVTIPVTKWEARLGRNLHRAAYQATTNLVAQTLTRPETAKFAPFSQTKITGVDWRFHVEGQLEAFSKADNLKKYQYEIYLKRGSNEIWTVEYLDRDKTATIKGLQE